MKTKLLSFLTLILLALSLNAQSKDQKSIKIGAGAVIGFPTGNYSNFTNFSYGIDLIGEYPVDSKIAVTLSAGFLNWALKTGYGGNNVSSIPVLAGGRYNFSDKFYGSLQAGMTIMTANGAGGFTFVPGIGYRISKKFDLLVKYQSSSKNGVDLSFLGLRVGYTF